MSLKEIVIREIQENGPISFHDFMESCLYYPGLGYYTSPGDKIGSHGDYYTSTSLGPLFGELLARQLEEIWVGMGKGSFAIVEYGAGNGSLCFAILDSLKRNKFLYKNLTYFIIDKNPGHGSGIPVHEKIRCLHSIDELESVEGCILSNELVDNFSVHQVIMKKELMEVIVDYQHDNFVELLRPAGSELVNYFHELGVTLPENFRTEINLEAVSWINKIAKTLKRGFVLTIDYGFPSYELYQHHRREGSLLCYHKHQVNSCPYENIGMQDITTHVNFSALHHWGSKNDLHLTGYTTQGYFLSGLGIGSLKTPVNNAAALLRTLFIDIGSRLKVLVQQKNMTATFLSGLRFPQRLSI